RRRNRLAGKPYVSGWCDIPRAALFCFAQFRKNPLVRLKTVPERPKAYGIKLKVKPNINKRSVNGRGPFNAQAFLDTAGISRKVMEYRRGESIYTQGDAAETVMYI